MHLTSCSVKYLLSLRNDSPHLAHPMDGPGMFATSTQQLCALFHPRSRSPTTCRGFLSGLAVFTQGPFSSTFRAGLLFWGTWWILEVQPVKDCFSWGSFSAGVSEMEPGSHLWVLFQKSRFYPAFKIFFIVREQVHKSGW